MSRKSQAFADGQQVFSWRIEKLQDATSDSARYKAVCRNRPEIEAFGRDEAEALRAAQVKLTDAIEKVEHTFKGPGQV